MAIEVAGKRFVTLSDEFFVNGAKVYAAFANGVQVYPDGNGEPDHIKIVVPPNKTRYTLGDTIDFTGMVVKVYDAAGNVCDIYPDGVIPSEDLILPITTASNYAMVDNTEGLDSRLDKNLVIPYGLAELLTFEGDYKSGPSDGDRQAFLITQSSDEVYVFGYSTIYEGERRNYQYYLCSKSEFAGFSRTHNQSGVYVYELRLYANEVNGQVFYMSSLAATYDTADNGSIPSLMFDDISLAPYSNHVAYVILFDQLAGGVPVQWERPSDGKILEDKFTINVTSDN